MEETLTHRSDIVTYPRTVNHVAISVPDIEKAVQWYNNVLGFVVIKGPIEIEVDNSLVGIVLKNIHGPRLKRLRAAWLISGNQVGIEIFEYLEPMAESRTGDSYEYWKPGYLHTCITDPNIEELCKKICQSGGRQRSEIWELIPSQGYKIAFCEDPFGNIIEICTNSYEKLIRAL
jgi:catechol 2,3-dioxygenase-like lactoylglutathione lyase family enzyme